jgi:glycosyltransferase involved in cell wall biosynthesis
MQCHLITPEYPPQVGGVSGYTSQLAEGLAGQGNEVHVWCPNREDESRNEAQGPAAGGVTVHRELGRFSPADLRRVGRELDRFPAPRHILVQWVPHGYGYYSMNLPFCWWLWRRAASHGDRLELMVHEPFLMFVRASLKQNAAAFVHRAMTILLLRASSRVWMSIPGWERIMKRYALGREIRFQWLPIFSNIPTADDAAKTQAVRCRYAKTGHHLIGHFGTYGIEVTKLLGPILSGLSQDPAGHTVLLMGERSEQYRRELLQLEPKLDNAIQATGPLSAWELAHHLSACDLLIQPYPDGVSTRRTSFMAGLCNGKPIVTTTGWLTEPFWHESDAVALAPVGDTEAFLKQVGRLHEQDAERLRLGRAADRLYRDRFDISHTISSLTQAETEKERESAHVLLPGQAPGREPALSREDIIEPQ